MPKIENLEQMLSQGTLSRREFLSRVSALGITAALSSTVFPNMAFSATAEPKRGGVLRIGSPYGSIADTLDPAVLSHGYTTLLMHTFASRLVEVGIDGKLKPGLVTSWEHSSDLKTWRFKTRKGVEFHNGKTMTVEDVVASINYHRHKDTKSPAKKLLEIVSDIKIDGKNEFIITLNQSYADFLFILGDVHIDVFPAQENGIDWKSGIATGPYIIERFEPGDYTSLKRNPNYWKEGQPYFDKVKILSIKDTVARTNALKTGKIDVMENPDLKTVHFLGRLPGINVEKVTGYQHMTLPMRTDIAPFDNNDLRLALKFALDRKAIVKKVFRNYGTPGNDHPISPLNRFHATANELPQREYDPEKAKFYLKKAGYDSINVNLSVSEGAFPEAVDVAILYKEHAAKAGINIDIIREPKDGYWKNVWMKKPWCASFWRGRVSEDMMLSTAYTANASWNESHWKNERFNKLLVESRSESNDGKRREMFVEMQRLIHDDGGTVVLVFNDVVMASTDKLQHGPLHGNLPLDGYMLAERGWFA